MNLILIKTPGTRPCGCGSDLFANEYCANPECSRGFRGWVLESSFGDVDDPTYFRLGRVRRDGSWGFAPIPRPADATPWVDEDDYEEVRR